MKKKELSNQEINVRYDRTVKRLKKKINELGMTLEEEELKLRKLLLDSKLNEENYELLENYIIGLKKLKKDLVLDWTRNIKRL